MGSLGSARQIVSELTGEGQRLPRRTISERRIRWEPVDYGAGHGMLTNPAYAGAYAFGRSRQVKTVDADGRVKIFVFKLPIEEWRVLITDHHPGYVTWEQYLATQAQARAALLRVAARPGRGRRSCRACCAAESAGSG